MTPSDVVLNAETMTKDELFEYVLKYPVVVDEHDGYFEDDIAWWTQKYGADYNDLAGAILSAWKNKGV